MSCRCVRFALCGLAYSQPPSAAFLFHPLEDKFPIEATSPPVSLVNVCLPHPSPPLHNRTLMFRPILRLAFKPRAPSLRSPPLSCARQRKRWTAARPRLPPLSRLQLPPPQRLRLLLLLLLRVLVLVLVLAFLPNLVPPQHSLPVCHSPLRPLHVLLPTPPPPCPLPHPCLGCLSSA